MELYRRFVSTVVWRLPQRRIWVQTGLSDTFHEAHLELEVHRDSHRILSVSGEFSRSPHPDLCPRTAELLGRLAGIEAWLGCRRRVRDAVGGPRGCHRWEELVLHAVKGVIQSDVAVRLADTPWDEIRETLRARWADTCNAYTHLKALPDWGPPAAVPRVQSQEVFRRYVSASVRQTGEDQLEAEASLSDSWHEVRLEMDVELSTRRITRVSGDFTRAPRGDLCTCTAPLLQRLVGQLAWPDQGRAYHEAVGGSAGCIRWEELVQEAAHAVMQSQYALVQRRFVGNPRRGRHALFRYLKGSCLAYTWLTADPEWNPELTPREARQPPS